MTRARRGTLPAAAHRLERCAASLAVCLLAGLALGACATPTERAQRLAASNGFQQRIVPGKPFEHLVFVKPGARPVDGFHVYLEGDGTPWLTRRRIAADPTPRHPLMLKLMALDPGPALYLGRPCYFGLMAHCEPPDWTGGRYSPTVVASLAAALRGAQRDLGWNGGITLIGHSGGGVLAMLLAARLAETTAVVTLAANLDVSAWARLHEYSALAQSLDPSDAARLPSRIRQIHLVGGRDRNVPASITRAGIRDLSRVTLIRFPDYDHQCCWQDAWRSILDRL